MPPSISSTSNSPFGSGLTQIIPYFSATGSGVRPCVARSAAANDASSGRASYGAGRYLLDTLKGADLGSDSQDRCILDFNFAYNPSCAYSPRWACPLSPAENTLPVAIEAGERTFAG